jgi:glycerol uptake operon antiterminator
LLEQTRIIPAVRSPEFLIPAATAPGKIVYFLCGNPENLPQMVDVVVSNGKVAIVNLDLVSGLSRDAEAIGFLARRKVQGVISTHLEPLRAARHLGLFAIERTFLLDSAALHSSMRSIDQFVPDALEVLPAVVAPKMVARLLECHPDLPVIAGGLVQTLRELEDLVHQGATAVSVSESSLWVA